MRLPTTPRHWSNSSSRNINSTHGRTPLSSTPSTAGLQKGSRTSKTNQPQTAEDSAVLDAVKEDPEATTRSLATRPLIRLLILGHRKVHGFLERNNRLRKQSRPCTSRTSFYAASGSRKECSTASCSRNSTRSSLCFTPVNSRHAEAARESGRNHLQCISMMITPNPSAERS